MTALNVFLWTGACIGHSAHLIHSVNSWYGRPLPHRVLDGIRLAHALAVPAVLLCIWFYAGLDLATLLASPQWSRPHSLVIGYVGLCCLTAFVILPAITLMRQVRRPRALARQEARVVDIATRLGYPPYGHGRYGFFARLPFNQILQVEFAEKHLCLKRLPTEWEGLRVLHVSDLHFGGVPDREFYFEVMNICAEWHPDLIAITGDIVDSDKHHRWILPVLSRLKAPEGVFAILGNHDTWYEPSKVRRRLRKLGIDVVGNGWRQIAIRGRPMVLLGHEGPWVRPFPDLTSCPDGGFRLCLSHTPDNILWAVERDVDLMLSGHNHGGQIRLPAIGSILVPSRYGRRYDCGVFERDGTVLHVVRGLAAQHPLRYHCRPEVALLILQSDPSSSKAIPNRGLSP
jgi:hypothetical protein